MWGSLLYQLQLAADSVGRKRGLSITIVLVMSLAGGMWIFGVCRYLRHHGPYPDLSPGLHQVDLSHGETPNAVRVRGSLHTTAGWATHTRVSYPEYLTLARSGVPARQTATVRSRLLIAGSEGTDEPVTLTGLLLWLGALLGTLLPAHRAAQIPPSTAARGV